MARLRGRADIPLHGRDPLCARHHLLHLGAPRNRREELHPASRRWSPQPLSPPVSPPPTSSGTGASARYERDLTRRPSLVPFRKSAGSARCWSTVPISACSRLTPDNCKALLFDDVLWVKKARQEHDIFVDALRERGVTVLRLRHAARRDPCPSRSTAMAARPAPQRRRRSATDMVGEMRGWLDEMPAVELGRLLIGGIARAELAVRAERAWPAGRWSRRISCCRRCPTSFSPATVPAGSTAASRSTRCTGRRAARKRPMSPPSTSFTPVSRSVFRDLVWQRRRRTRHRHA